MPARHVHASWRDLSVQAPRLGGLLFDPTARAELLKGAWLAAFGALVIVATLAWWGLLGALLVNALRWCFQG